MNNQNERIINFNAGPSALPLSVLEKIQKSFLNFNQSGMSITEISHRSSHFDDVINDAKKRAKRLLKLDDNFSVLFLQGGASLQFAMVPMNFLKENEEADYINTGTWSTKAINEVKIQKKKFNIVASSKDKNFSYIPQKIKFNKDAAYVHMTSNNTIKGTQFKTFPETSGVPIVCDMSSDIFSRPLETKKFGLIYAGAQKNLGPAGTCIVIIRKDLLEKACDNIPTMLKYSTHVSKKSMFNTPPCFGIYAINLVLEWIEQEMGSLEKMDEYNIEKANILYDFIDSSSFYQGTAEKMSRSLMNITFRLPSEELEKQFVKSAIENNIGGLKGHSSVGGCRASIYNAATIKSVHELVKFMDSFETTNK